MRDVPNGDATTGRTVSDAGLAFIKAHEGFRARAAKLADGRWMLGYSSVEEAEDGREITLEEADERLRRDLQAIEDALNTLVFAPLSQGQFDALVSLGFSIGVDALKACGVAEALNDGRPIEAAAVFDSWRRAQVGDVVKPVDALVRRRAAEKAMFLELESGPVAAPSALLRPLPDGATAAVRRPVEAPPESWSEPEPEPAPRGPAPGVIERINKILPEPPAMAAEAEDRPAPRVAELAAARARARSTAFPPAPYPIRRGMTAAGSAPRGADPGARTGARAPRGGAVAASRSAMEWTEQWPWFLMGAGLATVAVGAASLRGGGGPGANLVWILATIVGALALAVGGYQAARRLTGLDE